MKNARFISSILALVMMLTIFPVSIGAASDFNFIKIEEEIFVKNGTFDNEPEFVIDTNRKFQNHADGTWSVNQKMDITYETDSDNGYVRVDANNIDPSVSYKVGKMPAGEYTLSFRIKPEKDMGYIRLRVFRVDDSFKIDANHTLADTYNDDPNDRKFAKDTHYKVGEWNTLSIKFVLAEETDIAVSFYGTKKSADGGFCLDDIFLGRPADILLETADMASVDNATACAAINANVPEGKWTASDLNYLSLVGGNGGVSAVRKDSDLLTDTSSIYYTFAETYDKGEYRLSFEVTTDETNAGIVNVENATGNSRVVLANYAKATRIQDGKRNLYIIPFTIDKDDTVLAFRYYQANKIPSKPFSIDNVKLERVEATVVTNSFDTASVTKVEADNNTSDSYHVCAKQYASATPGYWFHVGAASGNDKMHDLGWYNDNGNGVLYYDSDSGTPSLGYKIGYLARGTYTVSFKLKLLGTGTGAQGFIYRIHNLDGKVQNASGSTVNSSNYQYSVGSAGKAHGSWEDFTFSFDVTDDKLSPYAFRIYPNGKQYDYYVDDLKIEGPGIYDSHILIESDDFSASKANIQGEISAWKTDVTAGSWAITKVDGITPTFKRADGVLSLKTTGKNNIVHTVKSPLLKGGYNISFEINSTKGDYVAKEVYGKTANGIISPNSGTGITANSQYKYYIPFGVANDNETVTFRFWQNVDGDKTIKIDNYTLDGYLPHGTTVYSDDFSTAPAYRNDAYVDFAALKNNKGKWVTNDSGFGTALFGYADGQLKISARDTSIYGTPNVMYRFENTFSKGDYTITAELECLGAAGHYDKYIAEVYDTNGVLHGSFTTANVNSGSKASLSIPVSLDSDACLVLCIKSSMGRKYTSEFKMINAQISKTSNPLIQLRSNADLAVFDSDSGIYYMAANAEDDVWVNYSDSRELRAGTYKLSGSFMTKEDGVTVTADVGYRNLGSTALTTGEWNDFEYSFTLKRGEKLVYPRGIRFEADSMAPIYFKDLKLVFVDELPQPAVSQGISMILLKKILGTYPGRVNTKPVNHVVNGDFDNEPTLSTVSLNYVWAKAVSDEWAYSVSKSDTVPEPKATMTYTEYKKEKCIFVESNTTPCISYALPESIPSGEYTFTVDLFVEGSGKINIAGDVFDISGGSAVRKTIDNKILSTKIDRGAWSTLTVPFTLTEEGAVVVRFWMPNDTVNFYFDNASVKLK